MVFEKALDPYTILVFAIGFLLIKWLLDEPKNLPPGPKRIPVIGNLLDLSKYGATKMHSAVKDFSAKYGGLFTLKMGSIRWVVVADEKIAREMFVDQADHFSDRPLWQPLMQMQMQKCENTVGLIMTSGEHKKAVRRFTVTALKDFGVGKKSLEERIHEEVDALVQEINKIDGQPFNPRKVMCQAVSNIISSICFGERFEYGSEELEWLLEKNELIGKNLVVADPIALFPVLQYFMKPKFDEGLDHILELEKYIDTKIEQHRKTFDKHVLRDFTDLFLANEGNKFMGVEALSDLKMKRIINDLFFAGSETTSTALTWALLYLASHPKVQKKCQKQIDKVLQSRSQIRLSDKEDMPYVQATINEILRISSVGPLGVPHDCSKTTSVNGYTIPKQTVIMLAIYAIHMDPKHWPDPEKFSPERWLDQDGQLIRKKNFLPFGLGSRICLGEQLARSEIFLFLTTMLRQFKFSMECENNELNFEAELSLTLQPQPFNVVASVRNPSL